MKEILEKIKNEINAIKEEQKNLEELTIQCDELKKEESELEAQRDEIGDPNSGFYQDVVQKIEEKHNEFIVTNNKRMDKNKGVENLITEKKEEIKKHIADKKRYIDENRKVDLEDLRSINVDKLKEEKEQLEREVELNNITREEFDTKTDTEKKEIRKAKENYLNNKHRLAEINPTIELIETLDGKAPKEKFMELNNLEKQIDTNFNKDGFDVILGELNKKEQEEIDKQKMLEEMISGREKREEERYFEDVKSGLEETSKRRIREDNERRQEEQDGLNEMPEQIEVDSEPTIQEKIEKAEKEFRKTNKDYSKVHLKAGKEVDRVGLDIKKRVTYIEISEKDGTIIWLNNKQEENHAYIGNAFEEQKAKFKRLDIYKKCREITGGPISGFLLKRKINPEIVMALDGYDDQLKDYINSVHKGEKLPFELTHDFRETGILTKIKRNKFAKIERKLGAKVFGKLFDKNETLEAHNGKTKRLNKEEIGEDSEPAIQEKIEKVDKEFETSNRDYSKVHVRAGKRVDRNNIKEVLKQHNEDNHIERNALEAIKSNNEESAERVTGDVLDKDENEIKEDESVK